jgi:polysaccharide export outer membrane protein
MKFFVLTACLALAGCGVIYNAPEVSDFAPDVDVRIVSMTPAAIISANRSNYSPRQLPSVFGQNAIRNGVLTNQNLPEPVFGAPDPPAYVETRLPEPTPNTPYQIGIGDVLVLSTQQAASSVEELSGLLAAQNRREGYIVQDDGAIAVPDLGRVQMAGLNLEEAEVELFQAMVENQLDPSFSIEVAEFNSKRAVIGGAVNIPTVLPITLNPITLHEAIAAAGGVATLDTQFTTIRLYRDGSLYQVALNQLPNVDVQLLAGDSVFVDIDYQTERAQAYFQEQITLLNLREASRIQAIAELDAEAARWRENFTALLDADAVNRDFVYLTGEVDKVGRFPLPFGRHANLADALFNQGGILPETGNPAEIYLLRGNAADQVTAYHLDASNPINLVRATDMKLLPNDIIFVAQQPVTKWARVVRQLTTTLILAGASRLNL